MNLAGLGLKVKVIGQGQGVELTDGRNSTFVISCALARRGEQRGTAETSCSGGVQRVLAW